LAGVEYDGCQFCVDCLAAAINEYGVPEIVNPDQGSQFTSAGWLRVLQENASKSSMDGRGRALDNIFVERLWRSLKYEDVYAKNYAAMPELLVGLAEYFSFYNGERFHPALGYKTPDQIYRTGDGGGAKIVDHFSLKKDSSNEELGQHQSAVAKTTPS
jgi:putative transposase